MTLALAIDRNAPGPSSELASVTAELALYKAAVTQVTEVCRQAARGNLEPRVLHIRAEGELAEMMHNINQLLDLTDAFVREAGTSLEMAADGKFYRRLLERGMHGAFRSAAAKVNAGTEVMRRNATALDEAHAARSRLADEFEDEIMSIVETVAAASTEVRANADTLAQISEHTSHHLSTVAKGSERTSENMGVIAAAAEELTATVREIGLQATESASIASTAAGEATRTNSTVDGLRNASEQIHSVVNLISEVAGQTRLLALNANIEAARAGDAGRGFAVVASEVKNLASQTAAATGEIHEQVSAIQGATVDTIEAIRKIGLTVNSMSAIAGTIEASVEEQREAAVEISSSVAEAARESAEMSRSIDNVVAGTEETSDAAAQMLIASEELSKLSEMLRSMVIGFVGTVRGDSPE